MHKLSALEKESNSGQRWCTHKRQSTTNFISLLTFHCDKILNRDQSIEKYFSRGAVSVWLSICWELRSGFSILFSFSLGAGGGWAFRLEWRES